MVTLTIDNSYSQITGLTTQQHNALKKILSYNTNPQAAFFAGGNYPTIRYLIDNKGNFPTGLLDQVLYHIIEHCIEYTFKDLRKCPNSLVTSFKFKTQHKPYKAQNDAVGAALDCHRGCISMPTGAGKSLVIALIAAKLNVKTLIVVPNLEIKKQLIASLTELFDDLTNLTVENIDSAALFFDKTYDCLIIDEAHHVAAKTYQKLNKLKWNTCFYRFFLTATPFRNNKEETLLFKAIAGDVIYELSYKEAIKEGYIVPVEAYYIEIPKIKTEAYTWGEVYSELVVNNEVRNTAIVMLLMQLQIQSISTLCLVKEIKHGMILADMADIPFANGQDEETRHFIDKFNKKKISSLIGTTGILGEGVNTRPCEFVIIAGLGKAKSAFMQQVGRAVRTYPGKTSAKIILIKDKSHKFCLRHYNEQVKILKEEYGIIPIKLEMGIE